MIKNIMYIINRFGPTFLFILLEILCFYMLITFNQSQRKIWLNSSNLFTASIYNGFDRMTSVINMREENEALALENAQLRSKIYQNYIARIPRDSLINASFEYIPALIINNSISKTNNYITLNKGVNDGIENGMGVMTWDGVVGVVSRVNNHYSLVNSLLNQQTRISGMLSKSGTIGDVVWDAKKPDIVNLESVPQYVEVSIGDTVTTSGYSTIFPTGHMIGFVKKINNDKKTGFYSIEVEINVDMSSIKQVYVIKNPISKILNEFENEVTNE